MTELRDQLGNRMKSSYEDRTRYKLPRRTYTIIRLDGQAFHTLTKDMPRPFYDPFMQLMDITAQYLCENIMGVRFSYVQSDEISLLLTDFEEESTEAWFDGNIQKICSISASMASSRFNNNSFIWDEVGNKNYGHFDSRVFTIPDPVEVENYFIWRQKDMERNSIQMVAQSLYNQKDLQNKKISDLHEMLHAKGHNWNDLEPYYKRGRCIIRKTYEKGDAIRNQWVIDRDIPIFTQERSYLRGMIPNFLISQNEGSLK